MAMVTEGSFSIFARSWTFAIIFCFAGCAAGSCLSYGHSCWGAHGKRSAHQPSNLHLMPTKSMHGDSQETAMPLGNEQWIMSRLIDGRRLVPLLDNYNERWNTLRKERALAHRHRNDAQSNGRKHHSSENEANEDEINDKETPDYMQSVNDEREESPEIILISRSNYKDRESKPQDLDLFKLLAKESEDFK